MVIYKGHRLTLKGDYNTDDHLTFYDIAFDEAGNRYKVCWQSTQQYQDFSAILKLIKEYDIQYSSSLFGKLPEYYLDKCDWAHPSKIIYEPR